MILRPDFYTPDNSDSIALRKELGLRPDLTAPSFYSAGTVPK